MNIISPRLHGYVDYLSVIIFLVAPAVLGLAGTAALISYVLAAVHLAMTLATRFPLGVVSLVPLPLHGWVERIVGPVLIVLSFVPAVAATATEQWFYLVMGVGILAVGLVSNYAHAEMSASQSPSTGMEESGL